jgi:hypothetical protein
LHRILGNHWLPGIFCMTTKPCRQDHTARANVRFIIHHGHNVMSNEQKQPDKVVDSQHGVAESQQDRKHDEAAKQRPVQTDLQIDKDNNRRPHGNAGQGE